jgi:hypothetical protein
MGQHFSKQNNQQYHSESFYTQLQTSIASHHNQFVKPIEDAVLFNHDDPNYKLWLQGDRMIRCGPSQNKQWFDVKYGFQPYHKSIAKWNVSNHRMDHHNRTQFIKTLNSESSEEEIQKALSEWKDSLSLFHQCITPLSLVIPKQTISELKKVELFQSISFANKIHKENEKEIHNNNK